MKIMSIRLAAYGPFTDVTIDLPHAGPDFHILFGPNEAGKSSALKALRRMLFGIPAQTGADFLHGYPKFRIGAKLVNSQGNEIEFLRRKGRAKTLRGADDETVLDDDALAPFLGGISAEVFEQMFAIGHEDLISGGKEIISGRGSVGEALFAAGAGLIRLQNVRKDLEQACGALFKPSGSTPLINQMIMAIKKSRKSQKEALLPQKTWQHHQRELRDAQKRLKKVNETLGGNQKRQAKLERIKEALPLIALKKEIDAELVSYKGVPDLSDDFGEKRRDVDKELKIATRDFERSREAIKKISKDIEALPIPENLIESATAIGSLQHELGSFRKAQKDRPGLEGRRRMLQKQVTEMLEDIGTDISGESAKDIKLPTATVTEIQNLGKEYERLTAKQESAREQHHKLQKRFNQLTEQRNTMTAPMDVFHLENTLQSAQESGPVEKQLAEMHTSVKLLENDLKRLLKRQTLWNGSLEQLEDLPLPSIENIDRFENRFDTLQRRIEKQKEDRVLTEGKIAQTQTDIQIIDLSQEVPTESDLNHIRTLRDKGWGLVRRKLDGQTPSANETQDLLRNFDIASGLPDAFEKSMYRADHISDRLRREADKVSRKTLLKVRKKDLEKLLSDVEKELEKALAGHSDLETEWQQVWKPSGITPQTPREMRGWYSEIISLRERLADLRSKKSKSEVLADQLAVLKSDLLVALEASGAPQDENQPFLRLIKTAQTHGKVQRDIESNIESTDKTLFSLKAELEEGSSNMAELESAISNWKGNWERSVKTIGLGADASPMAALAVIESVREVRNKIGEADVLRKRIDGIDRDSAEFVARVDELVDTLAPDLKEEPQDRAAELLNSRLTSAVKDESKQQGLKERLSLAKKDQEDADRRIFQCNALIETLCSEANCTGAEELVKMEKRSQVQKALTKELNDLEKQLRKLSAGATVHDFIADALTVEADSIAPELHVLDDEVEELEKDRSELEQKVGALNSNLKQMDGSSEAAIHAESAEHFLASLESDVEKFVRLKIASIILSRTVEQYREKHQGPLISRASELFTQMTIGAFSRLRADYDEKGNPVLVGIRPVSGAQVNVDGMSDGTADQLYLALRLASLEQYMENNEPLPFVVDDILLRFDNDRALATLDVLADLSEKTQVLFFTHHQHLIDLAVNLKEPQLEFKLHRLGE